MNVRALFRVWDPDTEHLRGGHVCVTGGGQAPGFEAPGGLSSPSSPGSEPDTRSASSSDSTLKGSGPCPTWPPPRAPSPSAFMSNVARAMHGMAGVGLAARLVLARRSGGLFCQDPGLDGSRAPPHPIKRWRRFHALLPNGRFSRYAGLCAGWIHWFWGAGLTERGGTTAWELSAPRPGVALSHPHQTFWANCGLWSSSFCGKD